jgi:hypothetical protein
MCVTHVQAPDAAGEIDERVAVDVRQRGAARLGGDDRERDRERSRISRDRGPGISVFSSIVRVVAIADRA